MFKQSFLRAITVKNILYFISILVLCIFAIILKFGFTGYSFLSLCLLFTALIVFLYFMLSLRKNRITKILKIIFTILVSLLVTAIIIAEIPILNTSTKREKANSPYCIVLGAAVHGDSPSLVLWERIQAAYDFLSQNPESIAILSGGQGPGENISEAQCMFENLMEMGILMILLKNYRPEPKILQLFQVKRIYTEHVWLHKNLALSHLLFMLKQKKRCSAFLNICARALPFGLCGCFN